MTPHFILRRAAWLVTLGLLLAGSNSSQSQVNDAVSVAFMKGKAPAAPDAIATLGPNLFGDNINLFNGSFSFEHTDFSLPGNNALPVALVRSYSPRPWYTRGVLADWDLSTPRIEGTFSQEKGWIPEYGSAANRCSGFGAPPTVTVQSHDPNSGTFTNTDFFPWEYGNGVNIVVPGSGSQEILKRNSANSLAPTDGNAYPLVTAKNWQIGCLPSIQNGTGQGFTALSPEGVRYRFDWMASRAVAFLQKGTILPRQDMYLMATQVTDRFGNWVKYTYDPAKPLNLTRIESSDGRVATLSYSGNRLVSASDGTRTWIYNYDSNGDLGSVVLPDSSRWQFSLRSLVDPQSMANDGYTDCDNTTMGGATGLVGTVTHPSGAVGTFTSSFLPHGRTNVTRACTNDPNLGANWTTGNMWPKTTMNQALTSKQISGPGMPTMTWLYGGDENSPYGEWAPCNNCLDRKTVTVTEPSGAKTRHTFGIKWHVNEGQLLKVEEGWNGSTALKTTEYSYRDAVGQAYLDAWGDSTYFMSDYLSSRNRPQDKRVTSQQGASFYWEVETGISGFNDYAQPKRVTKHSSLGYSRTELIDYKYFTNLWVLGQTEQVADFATGKPIESHTYWPTTAQLTSTASFGWTSNSFNYYADGTLQTLSDAAGHPTTFQNFMRGKPQRAVFADQTSASAVVNNLGNVASFTNEVNSSVSYGFDAMGRVSSISYPAGDPVTYLPTSQAFAQITTSEYGLPAGHWRQIIATGNATTIRWFDALWRVRLEQRYDAADMSGTSRFVETRYDAGGRKSFVSYPVRSLTTVNGPIMGQTFSYDDLNRVRFKVSDSELGSLSEQTEYLSGFQRKVTNPRNFATTMSFQAFDEPSEEHPVLISAPENVQVQFVRDNFGKTTSITRSGGGASVTRRYVYDLYERLCKTIEPEIGATVQFYDPAGNLAWRAPGLNLPSTTSCDDTSVATASKIAHGYDPRNRLTSTTYGDGSPSVTRTYFDDGLLKNLSTGSGASAWNYTYNARRLITGEALSTGGQTYNVTRGYNNLGNQISQTNPSGPNLTFSPNALGEVTGITGFVSGVAYHPNGAVAGYQLANGIAHSLTQNVRGLPWVNKDAGVMQDLYSYDADGNVSGIADQQENIFNRSMGYDGLDRLTSANSPSTWGNATYAYDAVDNLRAAVVGSRATTFVYGSNNQLTSAITSGVSTPYNYDPRGNLSSKGSQTFGFDLGNRLSTSNLGSNYAYDGHGRRYMTSSAVGTRLQAYSQAGQLMWATSTGSGSVPASVVGYTCPPGSTPSGSNCLTSTSVAATQGYSCPAGYSLSGSTCYGVATVAATPNYSCPAGMTLSNGTCSGSGSYAATPNYSCPAGMTLSNGTCSGTTTVAAAVNYSCPAGMTLSNSTCSGTTTVAASVSYSCPAGTTLVGNNCNGTSTSAATPSYSCPNGGTLNTGNNTCTTQTSTVATPVYGCPAGMTLSGSTCNGTSVTAATQTPDCKGWGTPYADATSSTGYMCGMQGVAASEADAAEQMCISQADSKGLLLEGYYPGGPGFFCRLGPVLKYSCPAGSTLSGSTCSKPVSQAATVTSYTCSSGTLSGSNCITTNTVAATVAYSCPAGATLSGSTCSTPTSVAATPSYSCSSGTLSGSNCVNVPVSQAASVTYSCASGTLSGSNCVNVPVSQQATVASYSCPSGGTLSGSTCNTSSSQAATVTYSCSSGTVSGSNCINVPVSQAATPNGYSCPNGGTLSGSTCTTTTSSAATPQYGCPNGGTPSGSNCVGGGAATNVAYIYLGSKQIAEVNNGVTQYVHTDALGSPVAHTNAAGALLNRTRFEAYGYPFAGTKPSVNTSTIGFTGHQQDAETDLVYMQQRYYDPIAGRFLSVDPIVTDANTGKGFGLYTYVDNNPYAKIDPDGRVAFLVAVPPLAEAVGAWFAANATASVVTTAVVVGTSAAVLSNSSSNSNSGNASSGNANSGNASSGNASSGSSGTTGDAQAGGKPAPPVEGATGGERFGRGPRIWEKPSTNPAGQANGDFDKKFPNGENVADKGGGVRVGTLPSGGRVIVRPGSSEGSGNVPTVEIQNPGGKATDKIRYPLK
jgi:RHS repeat-associated protein